MKPHKKPKRSATAILEEWQFHSDGLYFRYYLDGAGQQQIEWRDTRQTPRTEHAQEATYFEPSGEAEYANEDPAYTHQQFQDAGPSYVQDDASFAAEFTEDPVEDDLATQMESLDVQGYDDEEEGDLHHGHQSQQATGSSSKGKGKATEKKPSRRDDKKGKGKGKEKDHKGTGDKKGKGKGKEKDTRHHDEPAEPFYAPDPHYQAQPQQQQHRAHHHKKRNASHGHGHGHQTAPIGVTGGADPDDSQPVDPGYGARSAGMMDPEAPYYPTSDQFTGPPEGGEPINQMEMPDDLGGIGTSSDSGYSTGYAPEAMDENDDDFQRAVAESRRGAFGGSAGYETDHPGFGEAGPSYAQEADYEAVPEAEDDDDGMATPTKENPGLGVDMHIRATPGSYEQIDARYRVEPSNKFQPGEVFKILWSEPQGQKTTLTYTDRLQLENDWGERFYVGFRRFIVVANDEGHCTCVPILTYIRQGCKKKGVKPAKHGIVHEYGTKPRLLEGEPKLGFRPVRLQIMAAGERLARESRVNYSKLVTVEHNVKVFFIGNIYHQDFNDIIPDAVDRCWQDKIRKSMKKGAGRDHR